MMIVLGFIFALAYAVIDHWVGGARLFRGKANAELAERYAQTNGKEGKLTWYWDKRWLPYVAFGILTLALAFVFLGKTFVAVFVAAYLSGSYYWFRGQSPRPVFPAGNGQTTIDVERGVVAGGIIGVKGLLPAAIVGAILNFWLLFTFLLGVPLGLYHKLFHGSPLFRSYGELCQGGLVIAPFIFIHLWTLA